MPISVARKIEYFQRNENHDDLDIRLQPICLTSEQVQQYKLPRVPVKDTDLRKASFEANHGEGQVELDALEALHPGQLSQIVTATILQWYDPDLYGRAVEQRNALQDELANTRDKILNGYEDDITQMGDNYQQLQADYAGMQERYREATAGFQIGMNSYSFQLEQILNEYLVVCDNIQADLSNSEVDINDYGLPEAELPDDNKDELYISGRDYMEQLEAYKEHRNGRA
jgi:hypothetical protein